MNNEKLKIIEEYNKQDTESTANPYWVIRDYERESDGVENIESSDGFYLIKDGEVVATIATEKGYIKELEEFFFEYFEEDEEEYEKVTDFISETYFENEELSCILDKFNDEFDTDISVGYFRNAPYDKFIFLSRKSAEKYLQNKKHNFHEKAHVFCKSNWAGHEFNKLMEEEKELMDKLVNEDGSINIPELVKSLEE